MSTAVYKETEKQIQTAFKNRDLPLLQKETHFILTNTFTLIPEIFSKIVRYIKPTSMTFKNDPEYLFSEDHQENIMKFLQVSLENSKNNPKDFADFKLEFEKWFYETTTDGKIELDYESDQLISAEEASKILKVSKPTVYKYIERGLEFVDVNGVKKMPMAIVEAWNDPATAFEYQWIYQQKKLRNQTLEQKLDEIQGKITKYEKIYGDSFESKYGSMNDKEIDALEEAVDIFDWKEYVTTKRTILQQIKAKNKNG